MRRCHKTGADALTEWYEAASALPHTWDTVLPAGHFLLRDTLRVHETAQLPDVTTHYALLRRGEDVLAQAAFQVLRIRPEHVKEASLPRWQWRAWKLFTRTARPKLLVGGQLFRHDVQSLHWSAAISDYEAFVWYRGAAEACARDTGATAVLLKEQPAGLTPHFLHGAPEYLLLRNDISMQLPIQQEWSDMKDYEKSLKHKYAQRFRKVRQSRTALRVQELSGEEVAAHSADIYRLYRQVTEHQPVRMGLLNEAFIPALKRAAAMS